MVLSMFPSAGCEGGLCTELGIGRRGASREVHLSGRGGIALCSTFGKVGHTSHIGSSSSKVGSACIEHISSTLLGVGSACIEHMSSTLLGVGSACIEHMSSTLLGVGSACIEHMSLEVRIGFSSSKIGPIFSEVCSSFNVAYCFSSAACFALNAAWDLAKSVMCCNADASTCLVRSLR